MRSAHLRKLILTGLGIGLLGLGAAVPASAVAAPLSVESLSSPPAGAAPGHLYRLHGRVTNLSAHRGHGTLWLSLLHVGNHRRGAGSTRIAAAAHSGVGYDVMLRIPAGLDRGTWAVVACFPGSGTGVPRCVTAQRHLRIRGGDRVRGPKVKAARIHRHGACASGARTLSHPGDVVYPESGNGGYRSLHTAIHLQYDAPTNTFLQGTHVNLIQRATRCLRDFSLDFERQNASGNENGPTDLEVGSITVNGRPAAFAFKQPTYPGDPNATAANGWSDPDPNAHLANNGPTTDVGHGSLPPACTQNSDSPVDANLPCASNKLVLTPAHPIRGGKRFVVRVNYTGTPGVHDDGDGTDDGWYVSGDGAFVCTEPMGSEDWMPLNNHPSSKPTYDLFATTNRGKTAVGNGELVSLSRRGHSSRFPGGSRTWHWHSPEPIANYLVLATVGNFDLSEFISHDGIQYYEAIQSTLNPGDKTAASAMIRTQEDVTDFEARFHGIYPFTTGGLILEDISTGFYEEMQTKIAYPGTEVDASILYHENQHQWTGDNVAEGNWKLTFWKEGFAQLAEYMLAAREAEDAAGGPSTPAGQAAFDASLNNQYNLNYASPSTGWDVAPSNPSAENLFDNQTYVRPATAYTALRQILGKANWTKVLKQIERDYRGGSITEAQELAIFHRHMPNQSASCSARLDSFWEQWMDTAYPGTANTSANRPAITGPGLNLPPLGTAANQFYDSGEGCS